MITEEQILVYYDGNCAPTNIRKEKYSPATTTPTTSTPPSRSGDTPWILKQGGLESSGPVWNKYLDI